MQADHIIGMTWDGATGIARCGEVALRLRAELLPGVIGPFAAIVYAHGEASHITPRGGDPRLMTDGESYAVEAWLRRIRRAAIEAAVMPQWDGRERRRGERRAG